MPLEQLYQPTVISNSGSGIVGTLLPPPGSIAGADPLVSFQGLGGGTGAGGQDHGDISAVQAPQEEVSDSTNGRGSVLPATAEVVLDYPTVAGEFITGIEDIGLRLPESMLLANDSTINFPAFPDQQMLRITAVFSPTHGQVALRTNEEGKTEVVFIPEANYHGQASFSYSVTDQYGLSSVASATIELAPVNDAPLVRDDTAAGDEDNVLMFHAADLLANDLDVDSAVDGDVMRITRVGQAQHGQVFLDSDGTIRFVPDQDYNGPAQFTYWVADRDNAELAVNGGVGYEIPGTMHLTVIPVNDLPVVTGEQIDSDEDIVLDIPQSFLLANDTDVDIATNGQVLSITAVSNAQHGTVQLLADGTIRFIPELNYFGPASFSYTVDDGNGGQVIGTTVVNLAPVNDAPNVVGETLTFDEDNIQTIDQALLLANDSDVDNPHTDLKIIAVDNASHGVVTLNQDGSIRFVPDADYFGAASFTYTVSDGVGGFTVGTATLDILPVNDAPRLQGETATTDEDQVIHFSVDGLLANDYDVDNDHSELRLTSVGNASHGTVRLENGEIIFTPDLNYFGPASFTYVVDDGVGGQSEARVDINFNSVNDIPVVNDEMFNGKRNVTYTLTQAALLANDTDVEDPNALTIVAVQHAEHGTVVLNPNGTITFVPEAGYGGVGSFEYVVRDTDGAEVVGTTQIDFSRVNVNPIAVDDSFVGFEDTAFIISAAQLTANDTDPDPSSLSHLSISAVANASNGTVTLQADGSVRFMPTQDFNGAASFQYQVSDGEGGSTWATAYLTVQSVNDAPVIEDIWYGRPIYGYRWAPNDVIEEGGWYHTASWSLVPVTDEATAIALVSNPYDRVSGMTESRSNDLLDANGNAMGLNYYRSGQLRPIGFDYIDATDLYGENGHVPNDDPYRQNGKVIAYDVDGPTAALTFSVGSGPQHGHAWANEYTTPSAPSASGGVDHTQESYYAVYEKGAWQYYSHRGDPYSGSDPFSIRVTDAQGASTDAMIYTAHKGSSAGGGGKCPIVIDLDGDGIELIKPQDSHMFADLNGQGWREHIGWASTDDGILAFDANHDGHITDSNEISFVGYKEGARTDMEGLAAFDTDGDGKLTAHDAQWASFGILRDLNKNGVQDAGEFISLDQMGITSISLHREGSPELNNGNVVFGTSEVNFSDGHTSRAGDVMFGGEISPLPDAAKAALEAAKASSTGSSAADVGAHAQPSSTTDSSTQPAAASDDGGAVAHSEAAAATSAVANPLPQPLDAAAVSSQARSPVVEAAMDDLAAIRQMALLFNQVVATSQSPPDDPLAFIPAPDHSVASLGADLLATADAGSTDHSQYAVAHTGTS
ncbi:cadherin-like domain-containing protein [Herbaspirillum robiniae]|uniref:cadherin-like domain-containing protein n=1 Tax=Herbaspirillum robiniae TaxID=2014887 RepID=UPI003D76F80C